MSALELMLILVFGVPVTVLLCIFVVLAAMMLMDDSEVVE